MFLLNDVSCDSHAQSCAGADGLGCEKVLVQTLLHFVGHTFAVVGQRDDELAVLASTLMLTSGL